jgi:hypothetical protein
MPVETIARALAIAIEVAAQEDSTEPGAGQSRVNQGG